MDLYGQEPEARLLAAFLPLLEHRSVVDVGAERGGFVSQVLEAGSDAVYAIEAEPDNARFLRDRFRSDGRVHTLEYAASSADGTLELHRSVDPSGAPVPFGHTVLERPDADEIGWDGTISVTARTLASLAESGEIPARVGILKVDAEGHDLAVIEGMGSVEADVVMVEHWTDLPHSLGPCPWTTDEIVAALRSRGFSNFAFVAHLGEFVILKWNDGSVERGHMGNLVFVHDDVLDRLLPAAVACASALAQAAVAVGQMYATAAHERLAVIDDLARAADDRLELIAELQNAARATSLPPVD